MAECRVEVTSLYSVCELILQACHASLQEFNLSFGFSDLIKDLIKIVDGLGHGMEEGTCPGQHSSYR